jgi:hypothetical protein
MAKIVKVTVDDSNGEFEVDLTGYQGQGCDAIIEAFGEIGAIKTHVHKPEYRQTAQVTRTVKAGQ